MHARGAKPCSTVPCKVVHGSVCLWRAKPNRAVARRGSRRNHRRDRAILRGGDRAAARYLGAAAAARSTEQSVDDDG